MDAARVGEAVGPLAEERLHERLDLAVGLRTAGARVAALDAERSASGSPGVGAVAVAVVAEDALDADAVVGIPGVCAAKERDAIGRALAGQQLAVGQPRVVVDREVEVLPAGAFAAGQAVAEDRLADRSEAAEPLDVHVDELAGACALVALHRLACCPRQPRAAVATQHLPYG